MVSQMVFVAVVNQGDVKTLEQWVCGLIVGVFSFELVLLEYVNLMKKMKWFFVVMVVMYTMRVRECVMHVLLTECAVSILSCWKEKVYVKRYSSQCCYLLMYMNDLEWEYHRSYYCY
jgi:hypothetical protein